MLSFNKQPAAKEQQHAQQLVGGFVEHVVKLLSGTSVAHVPHLGTECAGEDASPTAPAAGGPATRDEDKEDTCCSQLLSPEKEQPAVQEGLLEKQHVTASSNPNSMRTGGISTGSNMGLNWSSNPTLKP
mmetsp:Transcript_15153/g.41028  ORF Transcript_15153/g.41028 Transcript_15153/m.41028 type:complete len:129 (+) Transcript_15153:375-761(+)